MDVELNIVASIPPKKLSSLEKETFFSNSVTFWYRHQKSKPQYYVLKKINDNQDLVREHIANNLYGLFGVRTPKCYIVKLNNSNYALASEYIRGYADLCHYLGGDSVINSIFEKESIDARIAAFKTATISKNLNFIGKAQLLVAAICLDDMDVIGVSYSNVGAVKTADKTFKLINIDSGEANITKVSDFEADVSLDNVLLNSNFSNLFANSNTIMGNMHLLEFFSDLSKADIKKALNVFCEISDLEIRKHIIREEYLELVEKDFLENIVSIIISRKNFLANLTNRKVLEIPAIKGKLNSVFKDVSQFSEPVASIDRGNSKPKLVKLISACHVAPADVSASKMMI